MRKLLLLMLAMALFVGAYAAPAYPGLITTRQSDGTTISFYLRGDEHFSFMMTEDGYLLVANQNGLYEYAKINEEHTVVPTGVRAHNVADRKASERNFVNTLTKAEDLSAEFEAMREQRIKCEQSRMPAADNGGQMRYPLKGSPKGLIILVSYSDVKFQKTRSNFDDLANKQDYSDNGGTGSIRDYFIECSNGQFTPVFDVYGPYTLPQTQKYYGGATSSANDANAQQMVLDACDVADDDIDFSEYDNDGDGFVDNIFIYFAGHNQAEGGGDDCIWPHRSRLYYSQSTYDGVRLSDYACTSELKGGGGTTMCGIGTFCHEFSHVLGLPDFYDTDYSSGLSAMGDWDIMTSGNYNNAGRTPPTYTAYERFYLGWLTPTALTNDTSVDCEGTYSLKSLISSNTAYLVSAKQHNLVGSGPNPKEFFMLEYRKREGRDTYSGLADGLLITHINWSSGTWSDNTPNNDKNNLGYYPILPGQSKPRTASGSMSDLYPYNGIDECAFILHGEEEPMLRQVMNIAVTSDSCTFDYVAQSEAIVLQLHDIEAYRAPVETQFVVLGTEIGETLTAVIADTRNFEWRRHTPDSSDTYSVQTLYLYPDSNGIVLDTIDVKYTPTSVTYDEYHDTKMTVKGTKSSSLTKIKKFRFRNRRPIYVTAPEAYEAQNISANSAVLSWSFVADTVEGTPDITKYGAKYYLDVYNISDQPQTETEGFENFPDQMNDDWSANFTSYSDQYRKSGQRSALFTSPQDTIYSKTFASDITGVSMWLHSVLSVGTFRAEVQYSETGDWELLQELTIDEYFEKDLSFTLPKGYDRLRLFYMPTEGTLAIDEVAVTTDKSMTYAVKNLYLRDTVYTVKGLELDKPYKYTVRATDKDEAAKSPRYENITEVSNEVEFTTKNNGQSSDDTQLVTAFDEATGGYWVSISELKTYEKDGKEQNYVLSVYDLAGMMVYRTVVTETVVYIPRMPGGLYTVKYSEENKSKKSDPMAKIIFRGNTYK